MHRDIEEKRIKLVLGSDTPADGEIAQDDGAQTHGNCAPSHEKSETYPSALLSAADRPRRASIEREEGAGRVDVGWGFEGRKESDMMKVARLVRGASKQ